jgi:hypothetical protein
VSADGEVFAVLLLESAVCATFAMEWVKVVSIKLGRCKIAIQLGSEIVS